MVVKFSQNDLICPYNGAHKKTTFKEVLYLFIGLKFIKMEFQAHT